MSNEGGRVCTFEYRTAYYLLNLRNEEISE